jgi:hypothetical protein
LGAVLSFNHHRLIGRNMLDALRQIEGREFRNVCATISNNLHPIEHALQYRLRMRGLFIVAQEIGNHLLQG